MRNATVITAIFITLIAGIFTVPVFAADTMEIVNGYYTQHSFVFKVSSVVLLVIIVTGVILGIMNKSVYYKDGIDVALSLTPVISVPIVLVLGKYLEFPVTVIRYIATLSSVTMFILVFSLSIKHNKNILEALIITISKIFISVFALLQFDRMLSPLGSNSSTKRQERITGFIMFTVFSMLIKKLTNYNEVTRLNNQ